MNNPFDTILEAINRLEQKVDKLDFIQSETQPKENPDELLLPKEACNVLRCSIPTLWRWEKSGKVQSVTIGGKRLYKRSDLLKSLNK